VSERNDIQARVARTILQEHRTVVLGGKKYDVAPPTLGTLILASEMIARMPGAIVTNKGREFQDIIAAAKDYKAIASFVAVLILGAKKARETACFYGDKGLLKRRKKVETTRSEALSREILDNVSPQEIKDAIVPLLEGLQLNDFFITTTFLNGINVTKPTKKVETKATASGGQSADSSSTTG
jgi:hypothetical protein